MAKLVGRNSKQGFLSVLWNQFAEVDAFTKLFIVIAALIVGVTPYVIANYQTLSQNAASNNNLTGGGKNWDTVTLTSNSNLIFGGTAYFQVSGKDVGNQLLYVYNSCYQNGTVVYAQYQQVPSTGLTDTFKLGPTPLWQSGTANCAAYPTLFNMKNGSFGQTGKALNYTVNP